MHSFWRAIRIALRYRWTVLAAMACSLTVGVLWGANIGTLYPFVQIVFRGESLQQSVSQTLAEAETRSQELQAGIERLRSQLAGAPPDLRNQLQRQIDWQQTRLDAERRVIRSTRAYQPYLDGLLPRDPFLTLVVVIAAMAAGTLLKSLALVGSEVLVARAVHGAVFDIQNEFYRRTLRMDLATFGEDRASVLVSCFTHRIQALTAALNTLFGQAVREPLKMAACLIGAALISWRLLVLSLLIAPLGILLLRLLTKSIRRGCRDDMNLVTALYQRVSESFQGILAIKAFTAEQREQARFRETTSRMLRQRKRLAFFLALTKPVSEVMGIGIISVAILASSYLVLHRETHLFGFRISDQPLSPAALMVFYGLLAGVADPARRLGDIYTRLFLGLAAAERVFRLMDREPQIKDPPQPRPLPEGWQGLVFEGVHFAYRPSEPVLRGVELRVARGERLALVGPNGCGKSTLVRLLARLYDPNHGAVRVDGIDLREFRLRELREQIGLVTQDPWLFDDTIMDNIRYGNANATDEEVIEAARKAQAHEFITQELEEGYQTVVGERGGRLSGGQRQRIALARAILRDPAIVILDEATSEIDVRSEWLIHTALAEFLRGRTAFLITHRLSTLELADRIVVMERGRIVDVGTHDELQSRCEKYQRLRPPLGKAG